MCPTSQTLSLKRIGRGFHFVSSPRVLFVFAANLGSVEFYHSVFTLETPPPPTPPPPPLAREILEQGSDWKHVSRKRQPERRASVLLGREARRAPRWKPQKKKKYKKQKTKNSALLSILDYSCPVGKFFALCFFQPYRCTRNIRVRALMHVVFACTVIAQKCKDPSLSMPIRTRVSVNPPCKK